MKKILIFLLLFIIFPFHAKAQTWHYPIYNYQSRIEYKRFGQYIDKGFYLGKESLFPNQFYGYHAADDLEILPEEKYMNVPVYAASDGKIVFIGQVSGYGGVVLERLAGENKTVLYGHIKISNLKIKVGENVVSGQSLAYLGNPFSSETGGEREHLHFGVYNGNDLYFRGYETDYQKILNKWINPSDYLKNKKAM